MASDKSMLAFMPRTDLTSLALLLANIRVDNTDTLQTGVQLLASTASSSSIGSRPHLPDQRVSCLTSFGESNALSSPCISEKMAAQHCQRTHAAFSNAPGHTQRVCEQACATFPKSIAAGRLHPLTGPPTTNPAPTTLPTYEPAKSPQLQGMRT